MRSAKQVLVALASFAIEFCVNVFKPLAAAVCERGEMACNGDQEFIAFPSAGEGNDMRATWADYILRLVNSLPKQFGEVMPQPQELPSQCQFDAAIRPMRGKLAKVG